LKKHCAASLVRFSLNIEARPIPVPIDGTREVTPFPLDFDIGFIDMPGVSCLSLSLFPELIRDEQRETGFPVSNGLMRQYETSL
jgi:hypothetical protein